MEQSATRADLSCSRIEARHRPLDPFTSIPRSVDVVDVHVPAVSTEVGRDAVEAVEKAGHTSLIHSLTLDGCERSLTSTTTDPWAVPAGAATQSEELEMQQNEIRGQLVAEALGGCPSLTRPSPELDVLWLAVREAICTRGMCLVTPLGSSSVIPVTADYSTDELIAAMEWLVGHEDEARRLVPRSLFIKLRGVATRGANGSARAAQSDALHGMTNVSPGDPVVFADVDPMEAAS